MNWYNKVIVCGALFNLTLCTAQITQPFDYRKLRERVDALVAQPITDARTNIIVNGIPKQLLDSWIILLGDVQQYVDFRTNDETVNTGDVRLTFQNLMSVKDELLKALRDRALSPEGPARQLLDEIIKMIQDKQYKIKNMPVLGLGSQLDVWYLMEKITLFMSSLFSRILVDIKNYRELAARK